MIALQDELGVEPSERTKQLYEQIRTDNFKPPLSTVGNVVYPDGEFTSTLNNALNHLEQFAETVRTIEARVQQEIDMFENALSE